MQGLRWLGVLVLTLAVFADIEPRAAESYPTRPVKLVVAFPQAGVGDLVARAVSDKLSEVLGQPVTVENRPGGTGLFGTRGVARAASDGYTLLVGQTTEIVVHRALIEDLGYDVDRDLLPVALLAEAPVALVVPANAPYGSVADLLKAARASSRAMILGSGGPGTPGHLAGELFRLRTRIRLTHLPFEGGGTALRALLNGEVDFAFPVLLTAMPQLASGKLKALAVSSAARSPAAPDIPTLAEGGVNDIDVRHWVGIFAPAGTPEAVVTRLNEAVGQVLAMPEVKDWLVTHGAELMPMSADGFAAFVKAESRKYTLLIRNEFCSRLAHGCGGFVMQ